MSGTLHVCAVPIGNLADASPRLREVLAGVGAIACEDTRTTGRLLQLLEVDEPRPRLLAHHDHNERASAAGVVELLLAGVDVALVSDAGSPAVSDPGVELVDAAHRAGIEVVAVPGPSAVAAALGVAGIGGGGYVFVGFLPRGGAAIGELAERRAGERVVAFESPARIAASIEAIAAVHPERRIAICRELTKAHEDVVRGVASELAATYAERGEPARGEHVLVLAPIDGADRLQEVDAAAVALVRALVAEGMRRRAAARVVAEHVGGSARSLYDASIAAHD